jgi:two-component system LytT family sensor kinase
VRRRWIGVAVVVYATAASSIGSAFVARRYFEHASFATLLWWQGPPYLAWALTVPLIERVVRTRSLWRVGAFGMSIAFAHAAFSTWWLSATHPMHRTVAFGERLGLAFLIFTAIAAVLWLREESRRAQRLEADLARAELEILKLQLQPHFLFNTLQSIAVLVKKEPDAAVRVTRDLAALLRVALRSSGPGGGNATLAAELDLVRHYVDIEQVRFGDRLRVVWDVAPDIGNCVIPELILQPIVENAVRHGVTKNANGGTVVIRAHRGERLVLEVTDDGPGFSPDAEERIGVGATRARLASLYGGDHRFTIESASPGTLVRMELPC